MSTLLVDASVWLDAEDPDTPTSSASNRFFAACGESRTPLGVLDLTIYEVLNAAAYKWRDSAAASRLTSVIDGACTGRICRIDPSQGSVINALSVEFELTAYDAAYVAASRELGWQLVSLDLADFVNKGLAVTPQTVLEAL